MNSFTRSITNIFGGAVRAFETFPAAILSALAFAIVTVIRIQLDWSVQESYNFLFNCLHWAFAFGAVFSMAAITIAQSRFHNKNAFLIANLIGAAVTVIAFLMYAKEYLGVPYVYGGATPDGFDCSGFTQYVAAYFEGYLPHSASEQYHYGISIEKEALKPGDLVFFETADNSNEIGHVGIYIGDGKFIHAPQSGGSVEISNLSNVYFDRYYYGAIRMDIKEAK